LVKSRLPHTTRSPILQNIPLRVVLIVPFLLIIASAVGALAYLSYRNGQNLTQSLAERLTTEMSDRIEHDLEHALANPVSIPRQNASSIRLGNLKWQDQAQLERSFWQQLVTLNGTVNEITSIGLTDEQKNFISVFKLNDTTWAVRRRNASTSKALKTERFDKAHQRLGELPSLRSYDPHRMPPADPWYLKAKQAKKGIWQIIVFVPVVSMPPVLVNSYTEPFYDAKGKFQGVTMASIKLSRISQELRQTNSYPNGQAFVMQRNGLLIGTSTGEEIVQANPKLPPLKTRDLNEKDYAQFLQPEQYQTKATRSRDRLTKAIAQFLSQEFGSFEQIYKTKLLTYTLRGERYFVRVTPLEDPAELNWLSVVVIPEKDFASEIQKNNQTTLIIYAASIGGALLSGLLIAEWIAKPILRLSRASQDLMLGKLDSPVQEQSRITELAMLARSFNEMTTEVLASFDRVKTALQESQEKFTTIFRNSPDPITISTVEDGRLLEVNASFLALAGLPQEQVIGKVSTEIGVWQSLDDRLRFMQSIYQTGKAYGYELRSCNAAGKEITLLLSAEVIELGGKRYLLSVGKDITDRKQLEIELRQSQAKLNDIFNSSPAGICSFRLYSDNRLKYDYVSTVHERLFGYTKADFIADPASWRSRIHPEDLPKILTSVEQITQPYYETEYRYQHTNGDWRWISDYLTFRWSGMEECWIVTVVSVDISDRKTIEAQLRRSEASLREAQSVARIGSWEYDPTTNYGAWSAELYRISGVDPTTVAANSSTGTELERIHIDDRASYVALVQYAIATGEEYDTDVRIVHVDGSIHWVNVRGKPVLENGKCVRLMGTTMDISDRKAAEERLRQSEERFRGAFFSTTTGMCITSPTGQFLQVNPTLCNMLGYSEAELLSLTYPQITHRAYHQSDWDYDQQLLAKTAPPRQYEKRYIHKNGQEVWALLNVAVVHDAQHHPLYFVIQIQDITVQKQIELALRESEERFRAAFETSHIGISIVSLDGSFIEVNAALCQLYGYSEAELLTLRFQDVTHPDDLPKNLDYFQRSRDRDITTFTLEKRYLHKDGRTIWGILTATLITDDQGEALYCISQVQDVTAQKQTEDVLRQERDFSRSLIQTSPVFFSAIDLDYRTLLINDWMLSAMDYSAAEVVAVDHIATFVPPDYQAKVKQVFDRVIQDKQQVTGTNPVLTKTGQQIWVEWRNTPVLDSKGNVQYFFGVGIPVKSLAEKESSIQ
jgi:PAS domain S-box-containing protein